MNTIYLARPIDHISQQTAHNYKTLSGQIRQSNQSLLIYEPARAFSLGEYTTPNTKSTQSTTQRSQQPTCYWYCGSRTQKAGESQQKCNKRSTNKNPYCSSQTCNNTNSAGQHNITQNKSPCCNSTKTPNSTATES